MTVETRIEIEAPAAAVWDVLTDLDAYASWNPLIRAARGPLLPRGRLRLRERVYRRVVIGVTVEVRAVEPQRFLAWTGSLRPSALFAADRRLALVPTSDDTVAFLNAGTFSGMLLPLFARGLEVHLRPMFEAMNHALKARVEARETPVRRRRAGRPVT